MNEFHKLEEKILLIEMSYGSLEEFVVASTFDCALHTLKTEEQFFDNANFDEKLTREFEFAELSDFWAGENGEFETW